MIVSGSKSFSDALSADASVSGSFLSLAKFSASASYKKVSDETEKQHSIFVESVAKCTQYLASLKRGIKVSKVIYYEPKFFVKK